MTNQIHSIQIDRLKPHPGNPNRMPARIFNKLVKNIERTGRYEPIVVRNKGDYLEIINGHHRCLALKQLGYKKVDVVIWDVDDQEADVLLATLNRLSGSDILEKKIALYKRLSPTSCFRKKAAGLDSYELARLLPGSAKQIERLCRMKPPKAPTNVPTGFLNLPLMFFVSERQQKIIDDAISIAMKNSTAQTKAQRKAEALTIMAELFTGREQEK